MFEANRWWWMLGDMSVINNTTPYKAWKGGKLETIAKVGWLETFVRLWNRSLSLLA